MSTERAPSGLVTSGVVELAAGALSGWVYALALYEQPHARRVGIVNASRVRQWHLDLVALGTGTIALGLAVPDAPKGIQRALATGAWTNAMLFLPLAFRPKLVDHRAYRAVSMGSFVTTSVGFTGMAITALSRRRAAHR